MRPLLLTIPLVLAGCYDNYSTDGDGVREPDEIVDAPGADILNSDQECDLVEDDILVISNAELDEAPEFSCWDLAGTLTLQGGNLTSLASLKHLRSVAALVIMDTSLTTLAPHRTIEVLGALHVEGNANLTSLLGLRIEQVEVPFSTLVIKDNPVLTTLGEIDQVVTLTELLTVEDNALVSVSFPKLKSVPTISVEDNDDLESVNLPALETLTDLIVEHNPELTVLDLPEVESLKSVQLTDNDSLTSLTSLAGLREMSGSLVIEDSANLADLGMLTHLRNLNLGANIVGNPQLSQCFVTELDECVPSIGAITSSGNLVPAGVCPRPWCK